MEVKICGLTRTEDAEAAVAAGAAWLGLNFYPHSPRCITPTTARELIAATAQVFHVAVLVAPEPELLDSLRELPWTALQIYRYSSLPPASAEILRQWRVPVIPAGGVAEVKDWDHLLAVRDRLAEQEIACPALLVDAKVADQVGGTGRQAPWDLVAGLVRQTPTFLAGGLSPENVAAAVQCVRPWGVDVASGVESRPGVKDAEKMRAFVAAVRNAANPPGPAAI